MCLILYDYKEWYVMSMAWDGEDNAAVLLSVMRIAYH